MLVEFLLEVGESFRNQIVSLPVLYLCLTVAEFSGFGIFLRIVSVGYGLAKLIVQLGSQFQEREELPFQRYGRNDIQRLGFILLQVCNRHRMAEITCIGQIIVPVFVINRINRVSPVRQATVGIAHTAGKDIGKAYFEVIIYIMIYTQIVSTFCVVIFYIHTIICIEISAKIENSPVIGTGNRSSGIIGNRSVTEYQIIPTGIGSPGSLQFFYRWIVNTGGTYFSHIKRIKPSIDARLVV